MIISHKYRYLFIQVPHTASTAIGRELCEKYDGAPILHKHAHYNEFLKIANAEEKTHFFFAGIRNPLDECISMYFKLKTNHQGNYTNPENLRKNGGFVTNSHLRKYKFIKDNQADFPTYFKAFFKSPYKNMFSWLYDDLDFIIRFENIQDDFSTALRLIGIEPTRPLPRINKTTAKKKDFLSYYTPEIYGKARSVFGPFMKKWGYNFPVEWGDNPISSMSQLEFRTLDVVGRFCLRHLRWDRDLCRQRHRPLRRCFRVLRKMLEYYPGVGI